MEKSNFDHLLHRYVTGQVSEQEKAKIEAWLDVMRTENRDNLELSESDEEKLFQKIVSKHDNLNEVLSILPPKKRISVSGWLMRIAAGMVVIALASYAAWQFGKFDNEVVDAASSGGVEKVILPDNSLVWLKGTSRIIYYEKEEENIRYAELKGEALFEVAKDPDQPFVVNCGTATLRVLGTSFSVRVFSDSIELKVLTGKVNISVASNKTGVDVLPNEMVVYPLHGDLEKVSLDAAEVASIASGTEYHLQFSNVPFADVVRQLEKKYDTRISIEDPRAGSCSITVDLTDQPLERSLEMITEILDVAYRHADGSIIVSGQGCAE